MPEASDRPDDAPLGPESADPPAPRRRLALFVRVAIVVTVAALVLAGAGAIGLRSFYPDLVRAEIVRRAQAMGLDVEFTRFEARGLLPWESGPEVVVLEDLGAAVRSAPGARLRASKVVVDLEHEAPTHVELEGLVIAADRVGDLAALMEAGRSEPLARIPFEADHVRVTIGSLAEALPFAIEARVGRVAAHDGVLELEHVEVSPSIPFVEIAPVEIALTRRGESSVVTSPALPGVTVALDDAATKASITLDAVNPRAFAKTLHVELPTYPVSGAVEVDLTRRLAPTATFDLRLTGFVPPHPKELGGIVFGKETRAKGAARLAGQKLVLSELELTAGVLVLRGTGEADPLGTRALSLSLTGSIGCSELAASAVGAHLGWKGSVFTSTLTRGRLIGTVGLTVEIRAQIDDLEHARSTPSAVVRCGVKLP